MEKVTAKIYLEVVLPLLEEVIKASPQKQEVIKKWNCTVQFGVKDTDLAVHLIFSNGNVKAEKGWHPAPTIALVFPSAGALISNFSGKKPTLSTLPKIKGIWHIFLLLKVMKLLKSLNMLMPSYEPKTEEEKKLKVTMLLYVVTGSMEILSKEDEYVKNVIAGSSQKQVQWIVHPDGPYLWGEFDKEGIKIEKGKIKRPYVSIEFKDVESAYLVLTKKVTGLEPLSQGLVQINGAFEYAGSKVFPIMQRVGEYLEPK